MLTPKDGAMSNDGTEERLWRTIQEVFERNLIQTRDGAGRLKNPQAPVKAGDTILLRCGYHGEIYCRRAYNDDYITIAAEPGHEPKVRRVFFAAAAKWIIQGLTVSPSFAPKYKRDRLIYVVDWGGPSADFVIEDNTLYSAADASSWSAQQWDSRACYGIQFHRGRVRHHHGITIVRYAPQARQSGNRRRQLAPSGAGSRTQNRHRRHTTTPRSWH